MTYITYWNYILFEYLERMNTILQYKYITLLGPYLDGFKNVGTNLWNFRCPLCGDSQRNANKKRGYIYLKGNMYRFHCHNCGKDVPFKSFLYIIAPDLYKDYKEESLFGKLKREEAINVSEQCKKQSHYINTHTEKFLINLTELQDDHPAIEYVRDVRRIPRVRWKQIFWTEQYQELINEHFGDKYKNSGLPSTGIVFVVRSLDPKISGLENHPIIGYQLRSIDKNCPKAKRFITCIEPQKSGCFGIDTLDWNKPIYVTEGPIDSLFLPNCIAVLTSALYRADIPNATYINDCEPRNKEIVKQIGKAIDKGYRVTLLPDKYFSLDINDIVCNYNLSESELVNLIETNSYKGLEAKLQFSKWRLW